MGSQVLHKSMNLFTRGFAYADKQYDTQQSNAADFVRSFNCSAHYDAVTIILVTNGLADTNETYSIFFGSDMPH